jgi:hypothetical protein
MSMRDVLANGVAIGETSPPLLETWTIVEFRLSSSM